MRLSQPRTTEVEVFARCDRRSTLERMPKWLICVPLVIQWLWLGLRYRGLALPAAANPRITSGGLVGEGKTEYFAIMGALARRRTASYTTLTAAPSIGEQALAALLSDAGLALPVIAKPNLGLCGYGVCRIDTLADLSDYASRFPAGETIVLQTYLPQENEAGIFYARDPHSGEGRIIGLTLRFFPSVRGDGRSTLGQLIHAHPRAKRVLASPRHAALLDLQRIPAAGETVRLSTIGSTRVGGLYRDGRELVSAELTRAIDQVARDMDDFHFGRFDVRFDSLAALRRGEGFTIMEVNGAGSEAIHAWDPDTGLLQGLVEIFAKQRLLFRIAARNRAHGARPLGILALARLNAQQNRLLDRYPPSN